MSARHSYYTTAAAAHKNVPVNNLPLSLLFCFLLLWYLTKRINLSMWTLSMKIGCNNKPRVLPYTYQLNSIIQSILSILYIFYTLLSLFSLPLSPYSEKGFRYFFTLLNGSWELIFRDCCRSLLDSVFFTWIKKIRTKLLVLCCVVTSCICVTNNEAEHNSLECFWMLLYAHTAYTVDCTSHMPCAFCGIHLNKLLLHFLVHSSKSILEFYRMECECLLFLSMLVLCSSGSGSASASDICGRPFSEHRKLVRHLIIIFNSYMRHRSHTISLIYSTFYVYHVLWNYSKTFTRTMFSEYCSLPLVPPFSFNSFNIIFCGMQFSEWKLRDFLLMHICVYTFRSHVKRMACHTIFVRPFEEMEHSILVDSELMPLLFWFLLCPLVLLLLLAFQFCKIHEWMSIGRIWYLLILKMMNS